MVDVINGFTLEGLPATLTVIGGLLLVFGLIRVFLAFAGGTSPVPGAVLTMSLGAGTLLTMLVLRDQIVSPVLTFLGAGPDGVLEAIESGDLWDSLYAAGITLVGYLLAALGAAVVLAAAYWVAAWATRAIRFDRAAHARPAPARTAPQPQGRRNLGFEDLPADQAPTSPLPTPHYSAPSA